MFGSLRGTIGPSVFPGIYAIYDAAGAPNYWVWFCYFSCALIVTLCLRRLTATVLTDVRFVPASFRIVHPGDSENGTSWTGIGVVGAALSTYLALRISFFTLLFLADFNWYNEVFGIPPAFLLPAFVLAQMGIGLWDWRSRERATKGKWFLHRAALPAFLVLLYQVLSYWRIGFWVPPRFWGPMGAVLLLAGISMMVLVATVNSIDRSDRYGGLLAWMAVEISVSLLALAAWLNLNLSRSVNPAACLCWACLAGSATAFLIITRGQAVRSLGTNASFAMGMALTLAMISMKGLALLPFIGFIFFAVGVRDAGRALRPRTSTPGFKECRTSSQWPFVQWFRDHCRTEREITFALLSVNAGMSALGLLLWWAGYLPPYP